MREAKRQDDFGIVLFLHAIQVLKLGLTSLGLGEIRARCTES